jgi:hypothetical protein
MKHRGLGDLNMTNKTKQTTLLIPNHVCLSIKFCKVASNYLASEIYKRSFHPNLAFFSLIITCVACAIGPSVNTLKTQPIFPSKDNFFNLFEFLKKFTQKSVSSTP